MHKSSEEADMAWNRSVIPVAEMCKTCPEAYTRKCDTCTDWHESEFGTKGTDMSKKNTTQPTANDDVLAKMKAMMEAASTPDTTTSRTRSKGAEVKANANKTQAVPTNTDQPTGTLTFIDVTPTMRAKAKEFAMASFFKFAEITTWKASQKGTGETIMVRLTRKDNGFTSRITFYRRNGSVGFEALPAQEYDAKTKTYSQTEIPGKVISGSSNFGSKKGDGTWYANQAAVVDLAKALVRAKA